MRTLGNRKQLFFGALVLGAVTMASCGSDESEGGNPNPKPDASTGGTGGTEGGTGGTAGSTGGVAGTDGSAGAPQDGWDPNFALPGINGPTTSTVFSVAITPARKIWVGGEFTQAGDIPVQNIAIWNGEKWSAAAGGLAKPIRQLAPTPDEKMYALTQLPDTEIHFWDGTAWTAVPAANDGSISAIDVAPDGTLYAAGFFTTLDGVAVTNIAKRTGGTWSAVGTSGPTSGIETVKVVGSQVCVGGIAEPTDFGVACFDGTTWLDRHANMAFGMVHSLAAGPNGKLYAAGNFMLEGIDTGGGLATWTGTEWELVGGGLLGEVGQPEVYSIGVDGDTVYAAGFFSFAGGLFVKHVAMWDGTKWSDMNGGLSKFMGVDFIEQPRGRTIAIDDGGEIYVGGRLTFAGAENALRVARWDGSDWRGVDDPQAIRLGINGFLNAIYAASDGNIYGAGIFEHLGGNVIANNVARFEPAKGQWHALGSGLNDAYAFAEKDGSIYATGAFVTSGTATLKGVARWDGAAWQSVGGGIEGEGRAIVRGPDGKLYVGGSFIEAGSVDTQNVAVWDGETWASFAGGVGAVGDAVRVLAFDASGKLYVGGVFTSASGTPASNVAEWDGVSWRALGEGVDQSVDSMVIYQDKLVIGGTFTKSGADEVPHVATWDPTAKKWTALGGGLVPPGFDSTYVQDMAVHGDDLYIVGLINKAGDATVSHVARFDGTTWHDVEGGVDDVAEGVTVSADSLWVGGTFTRAGSLGSIGIARYWFTP
jgi:hypothetical protein